LTDSSIRGNLVYSGALTNTTSTISGTSTQPLPAQVVTDFNSAYTALGLPCTQTIPQAAFTGVPLSVGSGVICFPAAVTFTDSVLTLTGNGPWIFRVGTEAAGALTGKNLTVVMASGGDACDVFWQVNAAATMTTSVFQGNILAGAAITTTGGTFAGRALATAGVTMTNTIVTGCDALPGAPSCKGKKHHKRHHHKGHKGDRGHDKGDSDHGDDDHDDNDYDKGRGKHPMSK